MVKIISLNIRGLGSEDKIEWVREISKSERPCVFGLQETKVKDVNDYFIDKMWNGCEFGFAQVNANGSAGGIITIWDTSTFVGTHAMGDSGFLAVIGNWKGVDGIVGLINVYGPMKKEIRVSYGTELGIL